MDRPTADAGRTPSAGTERRLPDTGSRPARQPATGDMSAGERADTEEDRRRQQDLDDAEMGGEA